MQNAFKLSLYFLEFMKSCNVHSIFLRSENISEAEKRINCELFVRDTKSSSRKNIKTISCDKKEAQREMNIISEDFKEIVSSSSYLYAYVPFIFAQKDSV